jgi:hypothetical protein
MRFVEFAHAPKPPTPEQARIRALKAQKDQAAAALKSERDRQRLLKAQRSMTQNKLKNI